LDLVGCLKITEDKPSDMSLTSTRRSRFNWNANLASKEAQRLQTRAWVNPRPMRIWVTQH